MFEVLTALIIESSTLAEKYNARAVLFCTTQWNQPASIDTNYEVGPEPCAQTMGIDPDTPDSEYCDVLWAKMESLPYHYELITAVDTEGCVVGWESYD